MLRSSGHGGAEEEEEEEDFTRWLSAHCLLKSGSGEEHIHMCVYMCVCVFVCSQCLHLLCVLKSNLGSLFHRLGFRFKSCLGYRCIGDGLKRVCVLWKIELFLNF